MRLGRPTPARPSRSIRPGGAPTSIRRWSASPSGSTSNREGASMTTASPSRPALNPGWLLLVPALALLIGVLFVPLFSSFWRSITDPAWTLDNYTKLFTDGVTLKVLGRTATSAAVVTVVAFLLG